MVDRTSNTTFYNSIDPSKIDFKANASNGDTITLPYGVPLTVLCLHSEDDIDAIPTATVSGGTITFAVTDDAGATVTADSDINGTVLLVSQ